MGFGQLGSRGKVQGRPGRLKHSRTRDSVETHGRHALSAAINPWKRRFYFRKMLVFLLRLKHVKSRLPRLFVRSSKFGLGPKNKAKASVRSGQVRSRPE